MNTRVVNTERKVTLITVAYVVGLGLGLMIGVAAGLEAAVIVLSTITAIVVIVCARTFRGSGEPVAEKRPPWRMTASPVSGFIWAAVFAVHVLSLIPSLIAEPIFWIAAAVAGIASIAFAYSSIRLVSLAKEKQPN